jgi:hypothetical protein
LELLVGDIVRAFGVDADAEGKKSCGCALVPVQMDGYNQIGICYTLSHLYVLSFLLFT